MKLQKSPGLLETYDNIISNQLKEGIVQKVDRNIPPHIPEFCLHHKPVVRENAESTKVRIIYDASARADNQSKSLNAIKTSPNLQNQIWKILVRTRFNPIFKGSISANKYPRNLQRCIKISLDKRTQSRKNRNIPIHKIGVWTYTITACTRRHSSTSLAELYQQI